MHKGIKDDIILLAIKYFKLLSTLFSIFKLLFSLKESIALHKWGILKNIAEIVSVGKRINKQKKRNTDSLLLQPE